MAKFPIAYVGMPVTADFWNKGVINTVWKASTLPRLNTATLADDPELAGMELAVGTHLITTSLNVSINPGLQTVDVKVAYSFTGTAIATRIIQGPDVQIGGPSQYFNSTSSTHVNTNSVRTLMKLGADGGTGCGHTSNIVYGLNDVYPISIVEQMLIEVTAIGNLALQWAQGTVNASSSVTMYAGSWMSARQIA
jgi:hypothetical protein